jgi:hypothetical protein
MEAQVVDLRDAQTLYENADLASIMSKTGGDEAFSDKVSSVGSKNEDATSNKHTP